MACLTPVVEDVQLVLNGNPGSQQVADGTYDLHPREVSGGIIVATYGKDTRMMASCQNDELVEQFEIVMVVGQKDLSAADGIHEVNRVISAGMAHVYGNDYVMPRTNQEPDEDWVRGIIIEVDLHR
jgi:hypothetical protein